MCTFVSSLVQSSACWILLGLNKRIQRAITRAYRATHARKQRCIIDSLNPRDNLVQSFMPGSSKSLNETWGVEVITKLFMIKVGSILVNVINGWMKTHPINNQREYIKQLFCIFCIFAQCNISSRRITAWFYKRTVVLYSLVCFHIK